MLNINLKSNLELEKQEINLKRIFIQKKDTPEESLCNKKVKIINQEKINKVLIEQEI